MKEDSDGKQVQSAAEKYTTSMTLFYPERKFVPEYKIEEKFEDFGGTYNQFNKRELASIDSLLFGSTEKKRVINGSELFDTNEKRMLEEERSKYMQFVCDQMSGFIPQILLDEAAFTQACKRSGKRTKLTKKRMVEVDEEGNPIEQKEVVFHSMGEDDDEEDDYNVNDYDGEDDDGEEGDD